jgi:LysM repeat protein
MKKTFYAALIVLTAIIAVSCASTAAPASQEEVSQEKAAPVSQEEVSETFDEVYTQYEQAINLEGAGSYTVVRGDTLSKITEASYGANNTFFFPLIMLASNNVVKDPDMIAPGMKLTIPDLKKNLEDPHKGVVKSFITDIARVYDRKDEPKTAETLRNLADSF